MVLFPYQNGGEIPNGLIRESKASIRISLCVKIIPFVGLGRRPHKQGIDIRVLTKAHVNICICDWNGMWANHVRRERLNAVRPHGTS